LYFKNDNGRPRQFLKQRTIKEKDDKPNHKPGYPLLFLFHADDGTSPRQHRVRWPHQQPKLQLLVRIRNGQLFPKHVWT
jgi:hypothetical protein